MIIKTKLNFDRFFRAVDKIIVQEDFCGWSLGRNRYYPNLNLMPSDKWKGTKLNWFLYRAEENGKKNLVMNYIEPIVVKSNGLYFADITSLRNVVFRGKYNVTKQFYEVEVINPVNDRSHIKLSKDLEKKLLIFDDDISGEKIIIV